MIENKSSVTGFEGASNAFYNGHSMISVHAAIDRRQAESPLSRQQGSPNSSPGSSPRPKTEPQSPMYPPPGFPVHSSAQGVFMPNLGSPFSRANDYLMPNPIPEMHYANRNQSFSMVSPNDPTANACKVVDFHGEKIAAFSIHGKIMLCLPQAFELFLKNLVGGLHTVYTKCKRLDIHPIVCNVEQVRVLRGLGAIQPGVNRCKLIADMDFEELMKDCNTSRPGRPPKRMTPITTFSSMPNQEPFFQINNSLQSIPFPPPPTHRDLPPGFNPFLPLGSPSSAQMAQAQAALLSRNGLLPQSHQTPENMLEKYGNMLRQLQGLQKDEKRSSPSPDRPSSPALNLSYKSEDDKHDDISDKSESELADIDGDTIDDNISDNSMDCAENEEKAKIEKIEENTKIEVNGVAPNQTNPNMIQFWSNIQGHIQDLVKSAIVNAKEEENHVVDNKEDAEKQLAAEKESLENLRKQIGEAQKQGEIYLRRFKKEKKLRRKIQNQLEIESFKKAKLEEALSTLSYKTFLQVKDLGDNESNDKENFA